MFVKGGSVLAFFGVGERGQRGGGGRAVTHLLNAVSRWNNRKYGGVVSKTTPGKGGLEG